MWEQKYSRMERRKGESVGVNGGEEEGSVDVG